MNSFIMVLVTMVHQKAYQDKIKGADFIDFLRNRLIFFKRTDGA